MSAAPANGIAAETSGDPKVAAPPPTLFRHSLIYGGVSFAAYGLSMVKAIVVARWFGISPEMDAFVLAILVPNLVGSLVTSTTAGALVPVLARAEKNGQAARATVFRSAFLIFFCICLLLTLIVALCSGFIARHLGSALDPYRLMLTTKMLRWTSLLIVATGVYAFCSAELLSRKRYAFVAAAPAIATSFSLVLILALHRLGPDILVWSLIVGTVVQAIVILVPTWSASAGGRNLAWRSPLVIRAITAQGSLLGAATIGVANVFIDQIFSTLLPPGNVSALNYASSLNSGLMQICVMSLAWVALPELSVLVALGKLDELRARLRYCIVLAVMISAPVTASVIVFGEKAIQVLLQHGRFEQNSTQLVFLAWLGFSLGLVPAAVSMIFVRLINALDSNAILFRIGAFLLIANAVLDYAFLRIWGLFGICLSTSLVYCLSLAILLWVMRSRVGGVLNLKMIRLLSFILAAAFVPIIPVLLVRLVFPGSMLSTALQIFLFMSFLIAMYSMLRLVKFRPESSRLPWFVSIGIASEKDIMLGPWDLQTVPNGAAVRKIRIAYVIGSLATGGAENQLVELLKNIDRERFEPSLMLFNASTLQRAHGLVAEADHLNIPTSSEARWGTRYSKAAAAVAKLALWLRRTRPDIVHAILPEAVILSASAAELARVPVLIGSRRSMVDCYRTQKLPSYADRVASRRCDVMLGNSESVTREIVALDNIDEDRVIRIFNGLDTNRFHPGDRSERQKYGWEPEHIVFGVVANFIAYKRHIDFIVAAQQIAKNCPQARFVMAGDDRGILDSLKAEIRERGLEALFTIIPGTREPEHLYPALDVYICSSETEGLSNVLLEAAACGLPIVATRVGGNAEIVIENETGLLADAHDPEALAAAALKLARDPEMRRAMGRRGCQRIRDNFSIRAMVTAHEALYDRLLATRTVREKEVMYR